jgi:hypothetical protein
MKFLKNLWGQLTEAIDEFIADLIGENAVDQLEANPQEIAAMVETDSYENW